MKKRINKLAAKLEHWSAKKKQPKIIQALPFNDTLYGLGADSNLYQYSRGVWNIASDYYSRGDLNYSLQRIAKALEDANQPKVKK